MKINDFLEEQSKLFEQAKAQLETSRLKNPDQNFPTKMREQSLRSLKLRLAGVKLAKQQATQRFDVQIKALSVDINRLQKELKKGDGGLINKKRVSNKKKAKKVKKKVKKISKKVSRKIVRKN